MVERHARVVRFGDFEFNGETGDLRRVTAPSGGETVRLAPQPAKLLALLLSRRGDLVDRDEIRRALWPDTHVDFDQSLAFCVRQLRAALGDSGSSPSYIETLPRRGFRLIAPVTEPSGESAAPFSAAAGREDAQGSTQQRGSASPRARAAWAIGIVAVAAAASLLAFLSRRATHDTTRLAIMPFELAASVEQVQERSRLALISESVMVDFADEGNLAVIGPRTTMKYHGSPFPDLDRLAKDLAVDYVLNGRYLEAASSGSPPVLIVELIRLEDRAHPWVERFDGERPALEIAAVVGAGLRQALARTP
jgi:DNA-binding winged helix-turn-helix (wHTH) protein/TolB-like protein